MITRFERNLFRIVTGKEPPRRTPRKPRARGPARDAEYLAWIRTLRCEACGRAGPNEAAHTGTDGGMSIKASDYSAIPLCARCHRVGRYSYHMAGRKTFAAMYCLDFDAVVSRLHAIWEKIQRVEIFKGGALMPQLSIRVEVLPGPGVFQWRFSQTALEMVTLAHNLQITVVADWNGFQMICVPGMTTDQLIAIYEGWLKRRLETT